MRRIVGAGNSAVVGLLSLSLVVGLVAGCASGGSTSSSRPTTTTAATTSPSSSAAAFPISAFAALDEDPVDVATAAAFQAALEITAGGGGISATVMTPGGMWSGAAGKADGTGDVTIDSQFGIASVTKAIVAAQVMLLVEAGEIALDTPASDYLPHDFTFDTNGATIRQLLSHRSGIPDWYGDAIEEQMASDRGRVWDVGDVLALVGPERRPSGTFEYADTNYNLLGLVIEHVRQRPLGEVLRDGALAVPGTERLIYQPAETPTDPMAMPRGESRDAIAQGGGYLPAMSDATSAGSAGAAASDSVSLARWWRAFCAAEIVSEASLNEMSTFYDNSDVDYGLGLFNPAAGYAEGIGHLGANFGYKASAGCMTADDLVVVVLTNQMSVDSQALARPLIMAARSN